MNYVNGYINMSVPGMLQSTPTGYSREADYIAGEKNSLIERLLGTFSFGDRSRALFSELAGVIRDASNEGWDGYRALPVTFKTYMKALEFISSIPDFVKIPFIAAEPDGAISMEWYRSPEWIFSISINGDGKLDYAALFGDRKYHGSMYFSGEIDKEILNLIGRV